MLGRKLSLVLVLGLFVLLLGGVFAQDGPVGFHSTQFNNVEESEKIRNILADFEIGAEYVGFQETDLINSLLAQASSGESTTGVIGALHGTFPVLANNDMVFDMAELVAEIEAEVDIADAFVELGKMGTTDYQYYVPWMQATYIMAANVEALEFLPEGADLNALTWDQLAEWGANLYEATGENKLGFPHAGLFNRFMQGYIYPSYTGGMVTKFKSEEAATMFEFLRDDLWPYVNAESITYEFMQEPLLTGEVWVAFDHTARLIEAFAAMVNGDTEMEFVAFPAPSGPAGLGFMPVIVGLGVPFTSPDPDAAEDLIRFLMQPDTQAAVLRDLAFFPVVDGVDMSELPEHVAIEAAAVTAQATAENALPALLPVGLGERGGEINEIYRNVFNRIVLNGEDIQTVLDSEGANLQALMDETGAACWAPDPPSEGACQVE